jgi:hypothetical protein
MNSHFDELLRQQRMMEQAFGGGANLILDELDTAKKLNDHYKGLSFAKSGLDELTGFSTNRLIEQMREESSVARLAREADALYGFSALEQARKAITSRPWDDLLSSIDYAALGAARQIEQMSSMTSMMRELQATERMLSGRDWAMVTGEALRSFQADLIDRYSPDSLYRELWRTLEAIESSQDASAEADAETIFTAIRNYLLSHSRKLTVHNLAAVFEIVVPIIFHIYLLHHLDHSIDEKIEKHLTAHTAEAVEEMKQHTDDLAEALSGKFEEAMAELAAKQEAEQVIKWAVGHLKAKAHIAPEHGSRKLGELLPGQVVIEFGHEAKWIQVEFVDHKAGVPKLGWVLKKHLTRVTPRRDPQRQ